MGEDRLPSAHFERLKPSARLMMLGQSSQGKSTLTAAISKVLADKYPSATNVQRDFASIDSARKEPQRGNTINISQVEYETPKRRYVQDDAVGHAAQITNLITSASQLDGAILVVAATDGPMAQTREHVLLAKQVGVPYLLVALNKSDMVDDEEILELVELEVRELLSSQAFDGENAPVVRVSALKALEGEEKWVQSVLDLMQAVDDNVPDPVRDKDKPFLMPIEDVFTITGRGTVVTGRAERGTLAINSEVEIVGIRPTQKTIVTGIEMFHKQLDEAWAGENCGLLLRGTKREDVERGQVVVKPGSVTPHTNFEGTAYILSKDEGGRHNPLPTNYRPQFYFRTTDVTGVITLPEGTEMVMPGDTTEMSVELIQPIAMEEGLSFAIREGGRTVGAGVITRIPPPLVKTGSVRSALTVEPVDPEVEARASFARTLPYRLVHMERQLRNRRYRTVFRRHAVEAFGDDLTDAEFASLAYAFSAGISISRYAVESLTRTKAGTGRMYLGALAAEAWNKAELGPLGLFSGFGPASLMLTIFGHLTREGHRNDARRRQLRAFAASEPSPAVTELIAAVDFDPVVDARRARIMWEELESLELSGPGNNVRAVIAQQAEATAEAITGWWSQAFEAAAKRPVASGPARNEALHEMHFVELEERGAPTPDLEELLCEGPSTWFPLWYGTNRRPVGQPAPPHFTNEPELDLVHFGRCSVNVPETHAWGTTGEATWRTWWRSARKRGRLTLEQVSTFSTAAEFKADIAAALTKHADAERRALVYVHGYNTSFEEAAVRAAQIGFDLKVNGIMSFFSWPSRGHLRSYMPDEARAEASEQQFLTFLSTLASVNGIETIDILVHSMGNRVFARTVSDLLHRPDLRHVKLGAVILAAPDIDADHFKQVARNYALVTSSATMYVSSGDRALALSQSLHDAPRAGFTPPVIVLPGIDTIEVVNVDVSALGHGYFAAAQPVLYDMKFLLEGHTDPSQRPRLEGRTSESGNYWSIRQ